MRQLLARLLHACHLIRQRSNTLTLFNAMRLASAATGTLASVSPLLPSTTRCAAHITVTALNALVIAATLVPAAISATALASTTIAFALGKRLQALLLGHLLGDLGFCFGNELLAARHPIVLAQIKQVLQPKAGALGQRFGQVDLVRGECLDTIVHRLDIIRVFRVKLFAHSRHKFGQAIGLLIVWVRNKVDDARFGKDCDGNHATIVQVSDKHRVAENPTLHLALLAVEHGQSQGLFVG
mmetsp:Transcript_35019/g.83463  ORF Transcript_35019/g.83463 Transcript_35019/m.83463 type:complete len:240 (-) Transcript_35019:1118-1837(-)